MNAWEVVALNKLYASPEGGFETLNEFFLSDKIDFNHVRKEIIVIYDNLDIGSKSKIKYQANEQIFSLSSLEKIKIVEETINKPIIKENDELGTIMEVCNLLSLKELAECVSTLFQVLDETKSKSCTFFISKDFAYVDILIFSALRRCRSWKKVLKGTKDNDILSLYNWHEWIKTEHKKGLFHSIKPQVVTHDHDNQEYFEALKTYQSSEKIRKYLDHFNIECFDMKDKKKTGCHIACEIGNLELFKLLHNEYNCNLEALDCEEMTPLFYALASGNLDLIRFLIERGVNLEHQNIFRETPFYWACYMSPSVEIILYLYKQGCSSIDSLYTSKRSPLNKAADMGRKDVVEFLVGCPEIKINEPGKRGRTALQMAVWAKPESIGRPDSKDYPEIAEILLKHGAQVNQKDHEGYTALITAAATGAIKSIPILIKFGANLDCMNNLKETPLYKASERGHTKVCQLLLEQSAVNVFLKSQVNLDCIEVSILNQHYETVQVFVERFPEKFIQDPKYFNHIVQLIGKQHHSSSSPEIFFLVKTLFLIGSENLERQTIETLLELKDTKILDLMLLSNHQDKQNLQLFIKFFLKIKWISGIKHLVSKSLLNDQWNLSIFEINLEELQAEDLSFILKNLNINIFQQNSSKETILHLLVRKKNTQALSYLCNFLSTCAESDGVIQNFLNQKNKESYSALDLAILHKDYVASEIIEQTIHEKLQTSIFIPSYTLKISKETFLKHKHKEKLIAYENTLSEISQKNPITEQEYKYLSSINHIDFIKILSERNLLFVETEKDLSKIASELLDSQIIGVDMECYLDSKLQITIVCLLQISSIKEDYLIDCLKLHPWINKYLQPVFEADSLLKVFHGCDGDLKWLKSNFDIDVVNLFDTSKAQMLLTNDPVSLGLSTLTQQFLNFELDKSYQKADWRVRPLPKVMMEYGRNDSCVLLFLWYLLDDEIKRKNLETQMKTKMARKCWKTLEESSPNQNVKISMNSSG